ncbi:flavin reductase [Rhodobacter sphaeroides]|mgnify:CR=1 FL=1|jgi:flavin reductase (DIM6/NTAB) family NADH-FMN oxidoreductase RutF|uniref:Nitrilotriacetate monooxygenase component B n=1 Tax=Cereibacter sphaeroides (strain ATCC 17023 / DSM 158 / JCM 6121 / CCUG 31486 / LMG 2827 / NBRC 12203 / NCIMB 8253 / ATH 2.4.1.) TaxID=272943 RepID=Q3J370_CERS4|nr:flavin reductase family protein [Cereibacter sphaeroides]ABN76375.1 flavin reductase domain protein, FMN-binding [Cereibacter sphaeroides ATCC 17029]ABA78764.1 nitrilotriacetate monooxygenase component B [Cereibacter sphaeroides 2.4.1]ACM00779.1 Flavin reductase domain protein, FMN-binding [Cereibacter sphaeroides KD131]AMJ47099.1 flavin oxidoreductase [Cereibacter sphaeroides]ANS33813.1 flavin oxidoreductase [Cereibacter sphaeroides]
MTEEILFAPDADARAFRDALGRFATGVTVVTVLTDDGPAGMTANSFASVSLDPPLVLWSPARSSSRFDLFANAAHYAIHVLDADQGDLAARFTRGGAGFEGLSYRSNAEGVPLLPAPLARFDCRQAALHEGGDHAIVLGSVLRATLRPGAPLLFSQGRFGRFLPES